jgi:hypothetical protein
MILRERDSVMTLSYWGEEKEYYLENAEQEESKRGYLQWLKEWR